MKNQTEGFKPFVVKSKDGSQVLNLKTQADICVEFLKLLAVAHQCVPEVEKAKEGRPAKIFYQGPSPDEVTLVEFAQLHGFECYSESEGATKVKYGRKIKEAELVGEQFVLPLFEHIQDLPFKVLRKVEFTSDRKRMSVLIQDPRDGLLKLYVKGADSEVKKRLSKLSDPELLDSVDFFLDQASSKGYRTLLMALKVLT